MKDWNVIVTVDDAAGFRRVRRVMRKFGGIEPTGFYNVLVLRVPDLSRFLEQLGTMIEEDRSLLDDAARIRPAQVSIDFIEAEEFESRIREVALDWAPQLSGHSFHVRVHRRGLKSPTPTPSIERSLDDAVISRTTELGRPARMDFTDPDYIIDIETVGSRAGASLWTRDDLRRFPFLRID